MKLSKLLVTGICSTVTAISFILPAHISAAEGGSGAKVGSLTCSQVAGTKRNLLITSSAQVTCTYKGDDGSTENYTGETGIGLGIDLSWKVEEAVGWLVIAPTNDATPNNHALAGKYYGAKAEATAGVGVQANVLVGGGAKSFTLQPLSLGGQTGFGAAAGLGYLYLEAAK
ncbi:MAG: hypothetical protein HW386_222 [Gammaproteobacteria bacterium]|nr:hypothetical protein [Gammaproteobacteria bacterium]